MGKLERDSWEMSQEERNDERMKAVNSLSVADIVETVEVVDDGGNNSWTPRSNFTTLMWVHLKESRLESDSQNRLAQSKSKNALSCCNDGESGPREIMLLSWKVE